MSIKSYIDKVIKSFNEKISEDVTDRIFLMIEHNEELMREYRELANSDKSKRGLNSRLGRLIREEFHLQNIGRCYAPRSKLIHSYERHSID